MGGPAGRPGPPERPLIRTPAGRALGLALLGAALELSTLVYVPMFDYRVGWFPLSGPVWLALPCGLLAMGVGWRAQSAAREVGETPPGAALAAMFLGLLVVLAAGPVILGIQIWVAFQEELLRAG